MFMNNEALNKFTDKDKSASIANGFSRSSRPDEKIRRISQSCCCHWRQRGICSAECQKSTQKG